MEKQKSLEGKLLDKEKAYISSPMPVLWKEISALRSAIDCLFTKDVEKGIRYTKQRFYEHGDKPGKCLAYLALKRAQSQAIAAIVDSKGNRILDI